jgi:hypothetical protein
VFRDNNVHAVTAAHPAKRRDLAAKKPIPPGHARLLRTALGRDTQVNRYAAA